jgi:hypothetical protein
MRISSNMKVLTSSHHFEGGGRALRCAGWRGHPGPRVEVTVATTDHDGARARLAVPQNSCPPIRDALLLSKADRVLQVLAFARRAGRERPRFDVIHVHALFSHAT